MAKFKSVWVELMCNTVVLTKTPNANFRIYRQELVPDFYTWKMFSEDEMWTDTFIFRVVFLPILLYFVQRLYKENSTQLLYWMFIMYLIPVIMCPCDFIKCNKMKWTVYNIVLLVLCFLFCAREGPWATIKNPRRRKHGGGGSGCWVGLGGIFLFTNISGQTLTITW